MFWFLNYLTIYQSILPIKAKFRLSETECCSSTNRTDKDNATARIKSPVLEIKTKPKLSSDCLSCLVHCACFTRKQLQSVWMLWKPVLSQQSWSWKPCIVIACVPRPSVLGLQFPQQEVSSLSGPDPKWMKSVGTISLGCRWSKTSRETVLPSHTCKDSTM